jgi:multiple sugar transport system permease protein
VRVVDSRGDAIDEAPLQDGALDGRDRVLGVGVNVGTYVNDWSAAMATAVMASVPAIVLLVIAQRYIAAGTTAGAVK